MGEARPELARLLASIADSTTDLRPVLDQISAEARRLAGADGAFSFVRREDRLYPGGADGVTDAFWEWLVTDPPLIDESSVSGRAVMTGMPEQVDDVTAETGYNRPQTVTVGNYRAVLAVPIKAGDEVIGGFALVRHEAQPWEDEAVEVATRFADQAAIAIRTANLLADGRQAQDREQSVGAVLATIARGTFDLNEVLQTVIEEAARLCDADTGNIAVLDGEVYRIRALTGFSPEYREAIAQRPYVADRGSVIGRTLHDRGVTQIEDVLADPAYTLADLQKIGGYRSTLGVPIWQHGDIIGVIAAGRNEVRPFAHYEVRLVETFADQVAIALNLARLLSETHEALERETAVSEVLQTISRSTFELDAVLQAVLDNAVRLSHADQGNITREIGGEFRAMVFSADVPSDFRQLMTGFVPVPGRGSAMGRALLERAPIQIVDVLADPEYELADAQRLSGFRTLLGIPMFRDGEPIGVLSVWRRHVQEFSPSEIGLLKTFADQAVLAIENVRLFETIARQRTELARYAPQAAELLLSSEGEQLLAGHRREITALFADLRGFTAFAEQAEPEEVFSVLRQYHTTVGELAVANGGTVEHFAGDGLMVFFNDPQVIPDHQLAAVRTACEMRERFGVLSTAWRKRGYELGLGIGIAAGFATLGRIGFEGRYDYAAIGNSVILASRLSDVAAAGQILVSQRVYASLEDLVEAEPVPGLELKGLSHALTAYAVASVRQAPAG